jgi:hypothetical protein
VDFDPEQLILRFDNPDELASFHRELTMLLREVTISVSAATPDAEQAQKHARALLAEFQTSARFLGLLRKHQSVPRSR